MGRALFLTAPCTPVKAPWRESQGPEKGSRLTILAIHLEHYVRLTATPGGRILPYGSVHGTGVAGSLNPLAVGGHQLERCRRRLLPNNLVYVYMCT